MSEPNLPSHRWYQKRYHVKLPRTDYSKSEIYDSGLRKIDAQAMRVHGYAANNKTPGMMADFADGRYYVDGIQADATDAVTPTTTGLATMHNSEGNLVWNPHNLVLNSATPATQSITVVSGASYTVNITGSGSVVLSGAGTGTATDGTPATITASTTTLTLTVSGSPSTMWAYRSDLGGMADNPDTGTTYVATTSAARYLPRRDAYAYVGGAWVNKGIRHESAAATNLLLNSISLSTQNVTVTAQPYTLHFTGTGTVTLSGASTAGPLVGTGTGESNRVSLTFTPSAGTLTLTVSGTVTHAQLE